MNSSGKLLLILAVVALLGLAGTEYFYKAYTKARDEAKKVQLDPEALRKAAVEENKKLVAEVAKLMELPSEEPTVATVTDAERLKAQAFFAKAKNGDKVLIYTNARRAILYDPVAKKIIDVAPINIGTAPEASPAGTTAGSSSPSGQTVEK